jgi:hypothetical protein
MAEILRNFSHQVDTNGNFDSVCPDCLMTISTQQFEIDLGSPERNHICDPVLLNLLWGKKRFFD